jgi:hypothetical protein
MGKCCVTDVTADEVVNNASPALSHIALDVMAVMVHIIGSDSPSQMEHNSLSFPPPTTCDHASTHRCPRIHRCKPCPRQYLGLRPSTDPVDSRATGKIPEVLQRRERRLVSYLEREPPAPVPVGQWRNRAKRD